MLMKNQKDLKKNLTKSRFIFRYEKPETLDWKKHKLESRLPGEI